MNRRAIGTLVGLVLVALCAPSTKGQEVPSTSDVQLQLRIVPQTGTLPSSITDLAAPESITAPGQERRFELQYRIVDLNPGDAYLPAGLTSGNIRITISGGGNSTLSRAALSRFETQLAGSEPPMSPDSSGLPTGVMAGATGLHRPYRGGIPTPAPNNDFQGNGVFNVDATEISAITPLSLSQSDQNVPGAWYGLYSFELTSGSALSSGSIIVSASFDSDSLTGNRFAFFTDGNPVPVTSPNATVGTISLVIDLQLGACCPVNAACVVATGPDCAGISGTYSGDNTVCQPSPCPALGACCASDGACSLRTGSNCLGSGEYYLGDTTVCSPLVCPQPGACCLNGQGCVLLSPSACNASGGTTLGAGSACASSPCAPPYACCFPGFVCLVASSSEDCSAAGGTPLLRNTCAPQACCSTPDIDTQPNSQLLVVGQPISLSVTATHTSSLAYQWRKDGANINDDARISGSNTSSLTISSAIEADAGFYDVVVTAGCGASTASAGAALSACQAPGIITPPGSLAKCEGDAATLRVSASGSGTMTFQWRKGGQEIPGAISNLLSFASVLAADAGEYDCVVTNPCGQAISAPATLFADAPPTISVPPQDTAACVNTAASFTITASGGTRPLAYQWRKGGSEIGGANAATYLIPFVVSSDANSYDCVVTSDCGSTISAPAVLSVREPLDITGQPGDLSRCPGESAVFSVTVTGAMPMTFQWRHGGIDIPGATTLDLTISSITPGDMGSYDCLVTNECGTVTSNPATLTVNTPPAVTSPPASLTRCVNTSASLVVVATGSPAPTYQWRKGGNNITGANAAIFTIPSVQTGDQGSYDCVVSNICASVTSSAATITVTTPPQITVQPTPQTPCEGSSATFTVTATGTPPLTYQWRKGGMTIGGATSASYTINSASAANVGSYDCVVTNGCGSATSDGASLTIASPPTIAMQPVSQAATVGTMATLSVQASGTEPLLYLWRRNGVPMSPTANIPSVTSAILTFNPVMVGDDALYDCVVANPCGTVTSQLAALNVSCGGAGTLDCNGNQLCDALELVGVRDITEPIPRTDNRFGFIESIDNNRLLIGARTSDAAAGLDTGAAYLYTYSGGTWTLEATLTPPDSAAGDTFGSMTALQGQWAVVGARYKTESGITQAGAVYIFRQVAGTWQLFQKLVEPPPVGPRPIAWFGHGIDIDGDRLILGSMQSDGAAPRSGIAYIYRFNGLNWALESTLAPPNGATGDGFGISVAIDDPYAIVGAPYRHVAPSGINSGAAYVYFRSSTGWVLQSELTSPAPEAAATYGELVAMQGDLAAVNAPRETSGGLSQAGAVYTYRRTDTRWTKQRRLIAAVPQAAELYGYYLAIDSDVLAVGGFRRVVDGFTAAGSVEMYKRRGNYWGRLAHIDSPKPESFGYFGHSLALANNRLAVGSSGGTAGLVTDCGWVRVFDLGALDCNRNGTLDVCEIASGSATDTDGNGVPDDCQAAECLADFNSSGVLSVQDIFDFLADYFEGNLTADFNDSGVLSVQDIFDYLASYFAGCA